MAALRSALATLSRGSYGSSAAAAYMGGRGLELNQVVRHAAPPVLPVSPLLHPMAVTRNFKGYRHFSSGVKEPKYKSKDEMSMWDRAKNRIANNMIVADLDVRSRVVFVFAVFVVCTPTVFVMKAASDHLRGQ